MDPMGDSAIRRTFDGPLGKANERARAAAAALTAQAFDEVLDVVPAARSLVVLLRPGVEPSARLAAAIRADPPPLAVSAVRTHVVATSYGGADGPDLAAVARNAGMTERDVIDRHAGATYTVAFIGFMPGFPYLLGMPAELATPRLETPRARVEAGSVGIGGAYTGVYPRATPGGWRIVGRADPSLFEPGAIAPGDSVRFAQA